VRHDANLPDDRVEAAAPGLTRREPGGHDFDTAEHVRLGAPQPIDGIVELRRVVLIFPDAGVNDPV